MAGMEFIVRQMGPSDRPIWAEMRTALWPDETPLAHAKMVDELLADGDSSTIVRRKRLIWHGDFLRRKGLCIFGSY